MRASLEVEYMFRALVVLETWGLEGFFFEDVGVS